MYKWTLENIYLSNSRELKLKSIAGGYCWNIHCTQNKAIICERVEHFLTTIYFLTQKITDQQLLLVLPTKAGASIIVKLSFDFTAQGTIWFASLD